jgi:hypothetical protein
MGSLNIRLVTLILFVCANLSLNTQAAMGITLGISSYGQTSQITLRDHVNQTETLKQDFLFPGGGYTHSQSFLLDSQQKLYLKNGTGGYTIYDIANDSLSNVSNWSGNSYHGEFRMPWLNDVIFQANDGTVSMKDGNGKTMIKSVPDGSLHIGENSLVTKEENGKQSLSAQDANGNAIDINITNGSKLLINGESMSTVKDIRKYDSRSVALSSALTSLPTNGGTGTHACGIGAGVRGEYSAMAMGCAADLENFELPDALPSFIKNASINAGTSFLTHDDPDYTFKVGMSFNFGKSHSKRQASNLETDLSRELALVQQKTHRTANKQAEAIKNIQRDNLRLQAKVNALRFDKEELLALHAANEKLRAQIDRINDLLTGVELVATK